MATAAESDYVLSSVHVGANTSANIGEVSLVYYIKLVLCNIWYCRVLWYRSSGMIYQVWVVMYTMRLLQLMKMVIWTFPE